MPLLLDSFWRAVAYCLHPRVIVLSLLPLLLLVVAAGSLGYFYWDILLRPAVSTLSLEAGPIEEILIDRISPELMIGFERFPTLGVSFGVGSIAEIRFAASSSVMR